MKCEKAKSENDLEKTLSEQLLTEIKAARLQSNVKSKITFPTEQTVHNTTNNSTKKEKPNVNFKPSNAKFQYGNYNKYYGYRNPQKFHDNRMDCLKKEWFKGC